jgi:hypothetical protein
MRSLGFLAMWMAPILVLGSPVVPDAPETGGTILIAVRTRDHMKRSPGGNKFDRAVDGVEVYLRDHHVVLVEDPLRKKVRIEGEATRDTLARIARDAGATNVLELVVNRPMTSWMELTARCWTVAGQSMWEERAAASNQLTSHGHVEKAIQNLTKKLESRLGGACLVSEPPAN